MSRRPHKVKSKALPVDGVEEWTCRCGYVTRRGVINEVSAEFARHIELDRAEKKQRPGAPVTTADGWRNAALAVTEDNRRLRAELALIAKEPCSIAREYGRDCELLQLTSPCMSCRARRAIHPDSRVRP